MIDRRRADLTRHLQDLRDNDAWHPFQHFVIGLLPHAGYTDVRHSNVRSDLGRDAVAVTPRGEPCVVAVSFECTKAKVLKDAKRWTEDPHREDATVLLFVTTAAPTEKTWSRWKPDVAKLGLELRMFHLESLLGVATRDIVWRETCARLGIPGDRPGFWLITPYDSDLLRSALQARPAEWLAKRIELREWAQLTGPLRNRLILGKPGAGKTTTLFVHLEANRPDRVLVVEPDLRAEKAEALVEAASGDGVIVFDDVHARPRELQALIAALRSRQRDPGEAGARYERVRLLLAARSQEWAEVGPSISLTELNDLELTSRTQVTLGRLTREQCRALVAACIDQWGIEAEARLLDLAAAKAAEKDATPLYVLSMLAPARAARRLLDEHLAGLPPKVLDLWTGYWEQLSPVEQGLLRIVKLFAVTNSPRNRELFDAATNVFSIQPHDVSHGLDALEKVLWISLQDAVPASLDVQLESIRLDTTHYELWDRFVEIVSVDADTRVHLRIGTGAWYAGTRASKAAVRMDRDRSLHAAEAHSNAVLREAKASDQMMRTLALNNLSVVYRDLAGLETTREGRGEWLRRAVEAAEEAVRIHRELGVEAVLAMSLNNASNSYADLAGLEAMREGRGGWLRRAVEAVEEAVQIYQELGVQGDLAMSLNNASGHYSDLAGLETTREGWVEWLRRAVEAVESAVRIYRELGVQGNLAMSLSNASNRYSAMAGLETTREGRGSWLRRAVEAVEEAIRIYRELGVQGNLAASLNNASNRYSALAGLETTREGRVAWLRQAVEAVEEAVRIYRELGVQGDLAASLNSASGHYSALAGLETTREGRVEWLRRAVEAVEEAVRIYRELGVQGDLAMSLSNASNRYSALAGLETTREGWGSWLRRAVEAVEEAVRIYRELGVQGDLAMSLNNASGHYSDLAGLETTREERVEWLRRAVEAVEDSVGIYRELGVQGDLAMSLNNASNRYSDLAGLETTREGQVEWLRRAVKVVEEAVRIRRDLGVQGDLAMSLNNACGCYSDLAGLETTREGQIEWLRRAVEAVGEAVRIRRELGVQGNLAVSLGASCRVLRKRAESAEDPAESLADLRASHAAIDEATRLFRESGNTPFFLHSLQDVAMARMHLARAGEAIDVDDLRAVCQEGSDLAHSMEDEERATFFERVLETLK